MCYNIAEKGRITMTEANVGIQKKYTHISLDERKIIERLLRKNTPKRQIARLLGRSITTIRKEIKRGSVEQRTEVKTTKKDPSIPLYTSENVYFADLAHQDYIKQRSNCGCKCKALPCKRFLAYVEHQVFTEKWSLDAAAGYAKEHHLFKDSEMVTTQTLYNWVDYGISTIKNIDLPLKVRRKTHTQKVRQHKRLYGRSIEERPSCIDDREEFGHWEGDGIVGKNGQGQFISLVERKTRFGILIDVGDKRSVRIVDVLDRLEKQFGALFRTTFKSITFDNGSEFADCKAMEKHGRTTVYYAHPYSSWERGTNENWNGIVRRFVPKGTSFDDVQTSDLIRIQNVINNLPRKQFHYQTPKDLFVDELDALIRSAEWVA